ncbi:MAG: GyrI-like domain-containing protein [Cellulosilyticaceae bacterium]
MIFDFKKVDKALYSSKGEPQIIDVPEMTYIAVKGKGNPNEVNGAYSHAIQVLYAVAYTIRMSYKGSREIKGFFKFVVPPLEGFWWQQDVKGVDYSNKETFSWIAVIRVPEFVTEEDFKWAVEEATNKKKLDCSLAEYLVIKEGLCVQMMHNGPFDDEPTTVVIMDAFLKENGYDNNFTDERLHHEIYLSDARKIDPEKWKTIIRHPIKKN